MVHKCSSYSNMKVFETLDSENLQDVTKQVFCCLQMPGGPGNY